MKPSFSVGLAYTVAILASAAAWYFFNAVAGIAVAILAMLIWRGFAWEDKNEDS